VLPIVERERQASLEAERRLRATRDALWSVPAEAPADAMLDFANSLQTAISGRLEATGTMGEVNQALRELFEVFRIHETQYAGPIENQDGSVGFTLAHPTRKAIMVAPFVKLSVAHGISDEWPMLVSDTAPPPLRWLEPMLDPEPNTPNSQKPCTKDRGYGFRVRGVATGVTAPARSDTPPERRADVRSSRSAAGAG
jgi:hypothetical protein